MKRFFFASPAYRATIKLKFILMFVIAGSFLPMFLKAQTNGDYRTINSGNWTTVSIWERYNGTVWGTAPGAPSAGDQTISIRNGHAVTVTTTVNADQTIVDAGGILTISAGTLQIADGAGTDLLVNGTMNFATSFLEGNGLIQVGIGGVFNWSNGNMRGSGTTEFLAGSLANLTTGAGSRIIGDTRTINSFGNCNWSSGTNSLLFANSVQFNNYGTFTISTNASFGLSGAPTAPAFNNMPGSAFIKSDASTTTIPAGLTFNNQGSTSVNNGVLVINQNGGVNSGIYNVATGAELTGFATISFTGPTFTNSGSVTVNSLSFNGSAPQTLAGNGSGQIQTLTVNNSAGVTLTNNQTVFFNLHLLAGKLITNANKIIVGAGANVNGSGASWVHGNMQRNFNASTPLGFDIGDANYYAPVTVTPDLTTAGGVTVRTIGADHPNIATSGLDGAKTVNRHWIFTNQGLGFNSANITFQWDPLDVDGPANTNNFIVKKYVSPSWTAVSSSNPLATSIAVSGVTSFGDFQVGESDPGAQDDYRTVNSGSWNNLSSWQKYNGTFWEAATVVPAYANANVVTIRSGHTITGNSFSVTIDQLIIENGAQVTMSESSLNIFDGPGLDLQCFGSLPLNTASLNVDGTAVFENGSDLSLGGFGHIGGSGVVDVLAGASFTIGGTMDNGFDDDVTINNYTICDWTSPSTLTFEGGTINFNNYDAFNITGGGSMITGSVLSASFNNKPSGNINNDQSIATANLDVTIVNEGLIKVTTGTLSINSNPPMYGGIIEIEPGATLNSTIGITFTGSTIDNNGSITTGLTMNGSAPQLIQGDGSINTFIMQNPDGVTCSGIQSVVVGGMQLFDGKLFVTGDRFIVGFNVGVFNASASSYVVGRLQRYAFDSSPLNFDIGDVDSYNPITVTPSIYSPGGIIASTEAGDHVAISTSGIIETKSVNRTWHLENNGALFNDYTILFNWITPDVDPGANPLNFVVAKYDSPVWEALGTSAQTATSCLATFLGVTFSDFQIGEPTCIVTIPDANFKNALLANALINTNSNSEIECSEASAYTGGIDVHGLSISDLTGIEAFTSLNDLTCYNNSLTTLNVSANTNLVYLSCFQNSLTTLNVSNNLQLNTLLFGFNQIQEINLSANTALTFIACDNGALTSLDLSANTALTFINIYSNPYTSLNIKNGNNSNLTYFSAVNCPSLTCIQVDDASYMNANWSAGKDFTAVYSTNCACIVTIPDANFKAALLANGSINTNLDGEIQCGEAISYSGTINVFASSISDLTGIEAFTSLTTLNCAGNQISTLDVSANTALISLVCSDNQLSVLDVTANTALQYLSCDVNQIAALDVSGNTALVGLWCYDNMLTSLNVSANTALQILDCGNNLFTQLDFSANTALVEIYCNNTQISNLNIQNGNNASLTGFDATNNPNLTCVQVDEVSYMNTNWASAIDPGAVYNTFCPSCIPADAPTVVGPSSVCEGGYLFLNLDQQTLNLNGSTQWVWYADSCGGNPITTGEYLDGQHPLDTTTYYVRGEGGCAPPGPCTAFTVNTIPLPNITFDVSFTNYSCPFVSDGTITVTNVSGGNPGVNGYNYSLDGNDFGAFNTTGIFTGLPQYANPFTVYVSDSSGCNSVNTELVTLGIGGQIELIITPSTAIVCPGETVDITVTATGGSNDYTITYDPAGINDLGAGTYYYSVVDNGACNSSADASITIYENPLPDATIAMAGQITACADDTVTLTVPTAATYALSFDGIDDYVEESSSNVPQFSGPRTIETWIKTSQTSTGNIITWGSDSPGEQVRSK